MGFRNKKGSEAVVETLFYLLFGLMLAAFFVFAVFFKVKDAVNDSTFHKRFYARDIALLVDSMHAANGNMKIVYYSPNNFYGKNNILLDIGLEKDRVVVTDRSDISSDKRTPTAFLFGYNSYVKVVPIFLNRTLPDMVVSYENKTITFKFPTEDVPLKVPEKKTDETDETNETQVEAAND